MSVVKVITKARHTRGAADSGGGRRYGLAFQVVTDDLADGPMTVGAALGVSPFDQYSFGNDFDPLSHAKEISIERSTGSPYIWDVEIEFDNQAQDWDENPLLRPAIVNFDFQPYERPATQTTDPVPQPIVNAAGMLFDPPIMIEDSRLTIIIQRNELVYPLATAVAYQNATNSDPWFGLAPYQGKMMISGQFTKESGYSFYAMTYEVHVRWETWIQSVANYGTLNKDGSACTEKDGSTAVSEPVPLSAAGTQLAWPIDTTQINFLSFNVLRQMPFSALGLP